MKQLIPIVAACLVSWGVAVSVGGPAAAMFFGMLGPLLAVTVTWLLTERAHRIDPAGVHPLLVGAFGVKMLFFGAYVAFATQILELELVAFTSSFMVYFIALYATQAVLVRNLAIGHAS